MAGFVQGLVCEISDSAHDLDWLGSGSGRFTGHWKPTQFNSLVPDAEKRNVRPSAPKGAFDFEGLTARLKPRPFKTKSEPEFFRSLLKPAYLLTLNDDYAKPVARWWLSLEKEASQACTCRRQKAGPSLRSG